eukprot:18538-Prorocentrum_lima.AAC.1
MGPCHKGAGGTLRKCQVNLLLHGFPCCPSTRDGVYAAPCYPQSAYSCVSAAAPLLTDPPEPNEGLRWPTLSRASAPRAVAVWLRYSVG